MKQLSRRDALKGTAVLACATGAAMPAIAAASEDPVLALRRKRQRLNVTICNLPNTHEGDEMANQLVSGLCRAEVELLKEEPQTLAGALAQVEQLCLWERDGMPTAGGEEIIGRLIEALPERIERLAAEVQS